MDTHHHRHSHCLSWRVETQDGAVELVVTTEGPPAILVTTPEGAHLSLDLTGYQLAALVTACKEAINASDEREALEALGRVEPSPIVPRAVPTFPGRRRHAA